MQEISEEWLKLVERALQVDQQLPEMEDHFPFPWERVSQGLAQKFGIEKMELACTRTAWKEPADALQGLGPAPSIVAFEIAPIDPPFLFVLPQADLADVTAATFEVGTGGEGPPGPKLRQGFYRFLLLKALQVVDELKVFQEASLYFLGDAPPPKERSFCLDITCALPEKTVRGRLVCPESALKAFKAHYPFQKASILSLAQTSLAEVTLRCEVGRVALTQEEWDSVKVGDFLMLDACSFDPKEEAGSVSVCLGSTPLFVARLKPEGMKVIDFAFYQEENTSGQPLNLVAEVGTIRMTGEALFSLKTEKMLALPIRPEQGVEITLGGLKVATAELIKLGHVVGLRLLARAHG